jgi:hypothetical protein
MRYPKVEYKKVRPRHADRWYLVGMVIHNYHLKPYTLNLG